MGNVPFSDEFRIALATKELWRAILLQKKGGRYSNRKIRRLETLTGLYNCRNRTRAEIITEIKKTENNYKIIKKLSKKKRTTFLESKAQAIADESGKEKNNIYLQLITREK